MKQGWLRRTFVPLLLVFVALFGVVQARYQSLTTDEGIHVASAYLAITRGEHRFDPEHPFLFKYVTALPLLPLSLNLPENEEALWDAASRTLYDSWLEARTWSDQWFYRSGNDTLLMTFLSRLPGVAVMTFFVWLVYFSTRQWFSERAARWAMFFAAFSPTVLAHGPLTNTDIPLATATLGSVYLLWRYFKKPDWKNAVWVGLGLAAALTVKFSAIILLPPALGWLIFTARRKPLRWKVTVGHGALALLAIWAGIWTVYGFRSPIDFSPGPEQQAMVTLRTRLAERGVSLEEKVEQLRYVLPSDYIKGLVLTTGASTHGRPVWALGTWYTEGQWFYFPASFLFKTQLVVLALLGIGLGMGLAAWRRPREWKPVAILLAGTALVIVFFTITSKLNLGIRHMSALFPFIFILLGWSTARLRTLFPGLLTFLVIILGTITPIFAQSSNLIGFMNIFTLPSSKQWHFFTDSNLEWGNQSERIAQTLARRFPQATEIYANYPWSNDALPAFGVNAQHFDPEHLPGSGIIILTAGQLPEDKYQVFRLNEPAYILGNHTFFYDASQLNVTRYPGL